MLKGFSGQKIPGSILDLEGEIEIPVFTQIKRDFKLPEYSDLRFIADFYCETATGEKWVVEAKSFSTRGQLKEEFEKMVELGRIFSAQPWLVLNLETSKGTRIAAKDLGIYLSGLEEIDKLEKIISSPKMFKYN